MKKCLFLWALALMVAGAVCSCSKSDSDDGGESAKPAYEDAAISNVIVGHVFECVGRDGVATVCILTDGRRSAR